MKELDSRELGLKMTKKPKSILYLESKRNSNFEGSVSHGSHRKTEVIKSKDLKAVTNKLEDISISPIDLKHDKTLSVSPSRSGTEKKLSDNEGSGEESA